MKIANYSIDKRQLYWLIPVAALVLGFSTRTLFYYRGVYFAPNVPTAEAPPRAAELAAGDLAAPVAAQASLGGTVLVDDSHLNNFRKEEFTVLFGRITAAGGQVEFYGADEPLDEALQGARAFVVTSNLASFQPEEVLAVQAFVREGGRLLIIGDPTRLPDPNALNSLAGAFGVAYQDDYVYNLVENDQSYLNVILHDFADNPLTEGLQAVVMRAAYSLRVAEADGLVFGDENTYSSLREEPGGVTVAALTEEGNVLALPDQTFLTAPYNSFADNDLFVDHIVEFLLNGERDFSLLDFPSFFSGEAQLVFPDSAFLQANFPDAVTLREALEATGLDVSLNDAYSPEVPMVLVADYAQLDAAIRNRLIGDGVRIQISDGELVVSGIGNLTRSGSALFHLHRSEAGVYQLFILVDGQKPLQDGLPLLLDGDLAACLLQPKTALCTPAILATPSPTPSPSATPTPDGTRTATPDGSGTPTPEGTPDGTPEGTPTREGTPEGTPEGTITPTPTPTASG
jgi:hypothetical protein